MSGQKNAYFANSLNTSHRPRFALASLRKATPRPAFDGERRKEDLLEIARKFACGDCGDLGKAGKIQKKVRSLSGGKSLSSVFTQTRLFWPDGVKILFLMLTYLSTLRSKTGFCLVRPEKCVFCKFTQHQPSPSLRSGEFKEGNATTSF